MAAASAVLSRRAECVPIGIVGAAGHFVLVEDSLGAVFEELPLADVQNRLKMFREGSERLSGLARNHRQRSRRVMEYRCAAAIPVNRPIRRNGDLAGILGVFDDLPAGRHGLGGQRQGEENQSGNYVFSHSPSVTPDTRGYNRGFLKHFTDLTASQAGVKVESEGFYGLGNSRGG